LTGTLHAAGVPFRGTGLSCGIVQRTPARRFGLTAVAVRLRLLARVFGAGSHSPISHPKILRLYVRV